MVPFKITLKNYRCFEDSNPVSAEIGPGFTAFVGPNNSGKSSFLKLFHELKSVFSSLRSTSMLDALAAGNRVGIGGFQGVEDPIELFYNRNDRPLILDLEFSGDASNELSKVRLMTDRQSPNNWGGEFLYGSTQSKVVNFFDPSKVRIEGGETRGVNLNPLFEVSDALSNAAYVGPFRNAISEGFGSYYDLAIGTSFIQMWDNWKTGPTRSQNDVAQSVTEDIAHIFGYNRLEINAANEKKTLQVIVDGKTYRLRELGAGLAQFIVVLGNAAIRRPSLLLIDEPELNLHPSLQADFLASLTAYTKHGVMFATHSIGLARTMADRIYSFQRNGYASTVRPFEQTQNFAEFVGEMSFSSFKEMGHETILLVEGVTEVKAVQQFLRLLGKDHTVVVVPLGGGQFIRPGMLAELSELTRLSKSVAVLIDSERTKAGEPLTPNRAVFLSECQALGFATHATDLRAFENYLSDYAIKNVKGPNYRQLAPYELLKTVQPAWAKSENWRIARAMAEREVLATDVGQFLASLK
jgi:ABC-type Mn2+/Zn2+ transport system ATPase subunit